MSAGSGSTRIRLFRLFRGPDSEAGVSAVEFALVAPIFLTMVLGIVDLGRAGFAQAVMFKAAQETSRWTVVNPRDRTNGETADQYAIRIKNFTNSRLGVLTDSTPTVSPVPAIDDPTQTTTVNLTITYDFDWIMPFVTGGSTTFTSHSNGFIVEDI